MRKPTWPPITGADWQQLETFREWQQRRTGALWQIGAVAAVALFSVGYLLYAAAQRDKLRDAALNTARQACWDRNGAWVGDVCYPLRERKTK